MAALTPTHGIEPWYANVGGLTVCYVQSKLRLDSLDMCQAYECVASVC